MSDRRSDAWFEGVLEEFDFEGEEEGEEEEEDGDDDGDDDCDDDGDEDDDGDDDGDGDGDNVEVEAEEVFIISSGLKSILFDTVNAIAVK